MTREIGTVDDEDLSTLFELHICTSGGKRTASQSIYELRYVGFLDRTQIGVSNISFLKAA